MENTTNLKNATEAVNTAPQMAVPYVGAAIPLFWHGVLSGDAGTRIPTGFEQLDKLLDGGLRAGLYVLLASPGAGKTTLGLQMMDSFVRADRDVIFFSGEMLTEDLLAKIYSRYSYLMGDERSILTAGGVLKLKENPYATDIAKALHNAYLPVASRTVIVPPDKINTITAIPDIVGAHIAATGNYPVVCIDYLQIIASKFGEATERQNVDKLLGQIKEMCSQYGIPVLLISSVNRAAYKDKLTLSAAKESGGIEYTADVVLGLDYRDPDKGSKYYHTHYNKPRELNLQILKNRLGTWGSVNLTMHAAYNYFEEEPASVSGTKTLRSLY